VCVCVVCGSLVFWKVAIAIGIYEVPGSISLTYIYIYMYIYISSLLI
jgi:hypothetical protein